MSFKIAIPGSSFAPESVITDAGMEVVRGPSGTTAEYIETLQDCDGALIGVWPLTDREVLEACPKLKIVSRMGVGVDSIDMDVATDLGILACNTPGVNTTEVADHAVGLLLTLMRMIPESAEAVKRGAWTDDKELMDHYKTTAQRVAGHTVGIIGFGNIGKAFTTRIRGFGPARIIAHDPYVPQTTADLYGVQLVGLDELLDESDFITVHTPHTQETHHIINADTLGKMKPTAILINCSRGQTVDGVALHAALRDKVIASAGIDVTEIEPIDPEDPLLSLDNIIVTPHLAGWSPTFVEESGRRQAENAVRVLNGERPHGLANPEVIKTIAVMRASGNAGRWEGVPDFSTALDI